MKNYISRVEEEGIAKVKMLTIITASYLIFWGPLYLVTVWNWGWSWVEAKNSIAHEVGDTWCNKVQYRVLRSPSTSHSATPW